MDILSIIIDFWHKITYESADSRIRDRLLMGSPIPILTVTFCNYLILSLLTKVMSRRKDGFKLEKLSLAISCYIWIGNCYFFYKSCVLGWFSTYNWFCEPIDRSYSNRALEIVHICHTFVLFKTTYVLELLVFILRKKEKLISFYMFFHHLTFPLLLWVSMNYHPGGHVTFAGFINSCNHVILFGAVIIRTLFRQLRGSWFKYTVLYSQGVQFLLVILHQGQLLFRNPCKYPLLIPYAGMIYSIFIAYLYFLFRQKNSSNNANAGVDNNNETSMLIRKNLNFQNTTSTKEKLKSM